MQHLLDFIHEHTLDEQVYLVLSLRGVDTELLWERRRDGDEWRLRPKQINYDTPDGEPGDNRDLASGWCRVHKDVLVDHLRNHGANMQTLESELRALVMTQIVFADMVLCDARKALGRDVVRKAVLSHRDFVGELNSALRRLVPAAAAQKRIKRRTPLAVIAGEGHCTEARSGHLSIVPPPPPAPI
ncbi:MAG: hypothetical protein OXU20_25530 [Myxococcales bacterium]|nr:hypothetical protein [Myxococcales bacterium]MDD9968466.1 hypothetical protein [Myxococcales bacterium]